VSLIRTVSCPRTETVDDDDVVVVVAAADEVESLVGSDWGSDDSAVGNMSREKRERLSSRF